MAQQLDPAKGAFGVRLTAPKAWRWQPSRLLAFGAAATSGAAIIVYALGWITLTYAVTLLAPLTALLFVGLLVRNGLGRETVLVSRLIGGVVAGAAGLVAYDLVRLLILQAGLVAFNPFRPIEVYGLLILDRWEDTPLTKAVGWGFHLWNGLSFAVMYTLAVGRGRLLWGLGWGLLLEISMLATYPTMFRLALDWPFASVSLVGHIAYGLTLGLVAQRVVRC